MLLLADAGFKYASKRPSPGSTPVTIFAEAFGDLPKGMAALAAQGEAQRALPGNQGEAARGFIGLLNWPVAYLMTFGLALAANFDRVLGAWRDWHANGGLRLDIGFLAAAARVSER